MSHISVPSSARRADSLTTLLIENLGSIATGVIDSPLAEADSILIRDGVIAGFGNHGAQMSSSTRRACTPLPG